MRETIPLRLHPDLYARVQNAVRHTGRTEADTLRLLFAIGATHVENIGYNIEAAIIAQSLLTQPARPAAKKKPARKRR